MVKKMRPMVSMEMDDEDQLDAPQPYAMPDKPKFPYGLCICLTESEFQKLEIDPSEAFVGGIVHIHALGRITSISANDAGNGSSCRVEIQLEDMCVEGEDVENEENN
jgi:hypothetical protein